MEYRINGKNLRRNEIRQLKRKSAEERAIHRIEMSSVQQVERLDTLLGKDLGATKERARLKELIEKEEHQKKKEIKK